MRQFVKFAISTITFLGCLQGTLSARAITFNWLGDDSYSATGDFTFNDANNDGFARPGEFTTLNITFKDSSSATLASYNLDYLQTTTPAFNFNYNIASNSVFQSGDPNASDGFSIGDTTTGYYFSSSPGGITFSNSDNSITDFGGTVTAVPFESSPFTLGFLVVPFAIRKIFNRLQVKAKTISQAEPEVN
ncbi:MAG: hypothetical protein HEQ24_04905 [Dolichospermum sp. BR01]|jgi:hypothetical protein|nr:hypothetical protein [Dolichospermum sp. BR01]